MNREQRRKAGISKETSESLKHLQEPCTIMEAVQLAQGVSEDSIRNYHETINPIIVSLSIQVEVLKDMLMESGALDKDKFVKMFDERLKDYQEKREEAIKAIEEQVKSGNQGIPKTVVNPGDVELTVVK